jgi:hypothetical protein
MANRPRRSQNWSWGPNKRRASTYFPSLRYDQGPESSMFIQDISSSVVPLWARRGRDERFKANISGTDVDRDRVIALLWSLGRDNRHDIEELVAGAIREIARHLSGYGRALYEVGRANEDQSVYLLSGFISARSFNLRWCWLQVVPTQDRELWERSITILPSRDVWVVRMPKLLGGYRGYRAILRKLNRFGNSGPNFWRDDLGHARSLPTYFNFMEYRREVEIFTTRITRKWGWNRRDFGDRNWTEFMQFFRTLTFHWAQALLREHIVSEFNLLLVRLGINAELSVSGLLTPGEILRIRDEMMEGKISFGKAFEAISAPA